MTSRLVERRYLLAAAVTVAAYYAAAQIGIHLAYPHTGTSTYGVVTAFWPPVGVGIAALVLFGLRLWPAVVIGDLLAGDYSTPLGVTLGQTLGTVVAVVVSAALLIRLGARRPGLRVRDVLVLMASTAAGTALGAGLGVLAIWVAGDLPALGAERIWRTWWLSDLAGALVVTPAVLTWANTRVRLTRRQMAEGAALIVVLLGLTDLASHHDVPYVHLPGADLGRAPLRPARRGRRAPRGVADHDLGHVERHGAVRAQLPHRQPAGDAAVRGSGRADLDDPRRRDGGASRERGSRTRTRARAGRTAPHRDAPRQRGRPRAHLRRGHARGGAGPGRQHRDDRAL